MLLPNCNAPTAFLSVASEDAKSLGRTLADQGTPFQLGFGLNENFG
jgi:hypothetical protein